MLPYLNSLSSLHFPSMEMTKHLSQGLFSAVIGLSLQEAGNNAHNPPTRNALHVFGKGFQQVATVLNLRSLALQFFQRPVSILFSPATLVVAGTIPLALRIAKVSLEDEDQIELVNTIDTIADKTSKAINTLALASAAFSINPLFGLAVGCVYANFTFRLLENV